MALNGFYSADVSLRNCSLTFPGALPLQHPVASTGVLACLMSSVTCVCRLSPWWERIWSKATVAVTMRLRSWDAYLNSWSSPQPLTRSTASATYCRTLLCFRLTGYIMHPQHSDTYSVNCCRDPTVPVRHIASPSIIRVLGTWLTKSLRLSVESPEVLFLSSFSKFLFIVIDSSQLRHFGAVYGQENN